MSRIRLKAPAPSATKVLSLEMRFELKSLVQSEVPRRSAPLTGTLEERPHMCPMWTTSGCLARRWPNHDSLNATRGTGLGVGFRGLVTPAYLYESGLLIDVNGLLRFGTALCTRLLSSNLISSDKTFVVLGAGAFNQIRDKRANAGLAKTLVQSAVPRRAEPLMLVCLPRCIISEPPPK